MAEKVVTNLFGDIFDFVAESARATKQSPTPH